MSELEQWCEIDGHVWAEFHLEYGPVFGPKAHNMSKVCLNCHKEDFKILVPVDYSAYEKWKYSGVGSIWFW